MDKHASRISRTDDYNARNLIGGAARKENELIEALDSAHGNGEYEKEEPRHDGYASGKQEIEYDVPEPDEEAGRGSNQTLAEDIAEGEVDIKVSVGAEKNAECQRGSGGNYKIERVGVKKEMHRIRNREIKTQNPREKYRRTEAEKVYENICEKFYIKLHNTGAPHKFT